MVILGFLSFQDQEEIEEPKLFVLLLEKIKLLSSKFSFHFLFLFPILSTYVNLSRIDLFHFFSDLMYPLFIQEEDGKEEISSMPDCYRLGLPQMMQEVQEAIE